MKDGEKEWAGFAKEIKAGDRKNFAQHLEERGLIHDVVGYVTPGYNELMAFAAGNSLNGSLIVSFGLQRTGLVA